jgi:plastocyanin
MRIFLCALILVVAGCSQGGNPSAPAASATQSPGAAPTTGVTATPIQVKDFTLEPKDVRIRGVVSLAVTNDGPTIHNVTIRDASGTIMGATKDLKSGEPETLTIDLPAGTYTIFCSLPGHESLGVKGTLTVSK